MSELSDEILDHQRGTSPHEAFDEMPESTTEAIEAAVEPPDNRFIPLRAEELLRALEDAPIPDLNYQDLCRVFERLREVIDQEARCFERDLLEQYHPFWPDADTEPPTTPDAHAESDFLRALGYLFDRANCERLSEVQLTEAIRTANTHGLRVEIDHTAVRHLEVFVRGRGTVTRRFRSARAPVRGRPREIEVFKRLILIVSFHKDEHVLLKLFRDIPLADLEALMPHARVRMNWFDRVKVFGGGAGALGGVAPKLWAAFIGGAALSAGFFWVAMAALLGLSLKSFFGYRNTMRHRTGQRTQHLYYQNLANNAGVITTLLHHVCQEELKEAVLAYAFSTDPSVRTEADLDEKVEAWILKRLDITVNYDCPDALETIARLALWGDRETMTPLAPDSACRVLDEHWREHRSAEYHQERLSNSL